MNQTTHLSLWAFVALILCAPALRASGDDTTVVPLGSLVHQQTIQGKLSPKSVVASGTGLFFAQNMMYRHTVSVYNREFELVKIINDQVVLEDFGFEDYGRKAYRGAPVEADFSHDGAFAWVSNYQMYGDSMNAPGCDGCAISQGYDKSFVYKINTSTFEIEQVIRVGSVPKYLRVTPNNRYVLVSNWSSGDLSVIDIRKGTEIRRLKLGRYPRGIEVSENSQFAFVALMGSDRIAKINLIDFSISWIHDVGRAPRHLCLDKANRYLYASINNENRVVKIDLATDSVLGGVRTGSAPRSMVLSGNDRFLYVVNYFSNKVSKVRVDNMEVVESHATKDKPIGITFDPQTNQVWVACYSGSLMVFEETSYPAGLGAEDDLAFGLAKYIDYRGQPTYRRGCFHIDGYVNYASDASLLPPEPNVDGYPLVPQLVESTAIAAELTPAPIEEEEEPEAIIPDPVVIAEPEVKEPEPAVVVETPQPVVSSAKGDYCVIGGSFRAIENANRHRDEMVEHGFANATVIKRASGNYLVTFGLYQTSAEAEIAMKGIRQKMEPSAWLWKRP